MTIEEMQDEATELTRALRNRGLDPAEAITVLLMALITVDRNAVRPDSTQSTFDGFLKTVQEGLVALKPEGVYEVPEGTTKH